MLRYGDSAKRSERATAAMATATSVEALGPGEHACLTFSDPDERLDIVAAFVRDGLSTATKVICVTESIPPEQLTAELSDRGVPVADALPTNQLMIFSISRKTISAECFWRMCTSSCRVIIFSSGVSLPINK